MKKEKLILLILIGVFGLYNMEQSKQLVKHKHLLNREIKNTIISNNNSNKGLLQLNNDTIEIKK